MQGTPHTEVLLVISNLPDIDSAESLARTVLEQRLAACVNIMPACRSLYWWKGQIEQSAEIPVFFKTTRRRFAALQTCIRAHHPYELPEVIAIPLTDGLPEYLRWVDNEVEEQ